MDERSAVSRGPDRGRWLMVAALILLGIALYFWFAPSSRPAAPPTVRSRSERTGAGDAARRQRPGGGVRARPRAPSPRASAPGWPAPRSPPGWTAPSGTSTGRIERDVSLAILTDRDPDALEVLRHSAAHVLATAVRELFPGAGIGFGPPIEDGFYYDFEVPRPFTPEDLERIEARMGEVAQADYPFVREVVDRAGANRRFADDPLKLERIGELGDDETITVYTDGPFTDLCRGPHIPRTGRLKHFKLLHAAGAYWRGDEKRQMLQRIYGTAWFKKEDLDAYLHRLEEARKRDHRVLGRQLDLFSISDVVGPGLRALAPRGRHDQVAALPRRRGRQRRQRLRPGLHAQRHQGRAVQDLGPPAALRRQPVSGDGGRGRRGGGRALPGQADELPDARC